MILEDSGPVGTASTPAEGVDARIAAWLLGGGTQIRAGAHSGGIVGAFDADGLARYLYPEITGYYLQWLASLATRTTCSDALSERARAAQRWLAATITEDDAPPTRVYLRGEHRDWRNSAVFCFDLAMVLRGLAAATAQRLIDADIKLVTAVCVWLDRMIASDGEFDACLVMPRGAAVTDRWSTRRGAFLSKAASGMIVAGTVLPIPDRILRAAQATFAASLQRAQQMPHEDTHAFLYTLEGVLAAGNDLQARTALPMLTQQFAWLLDRAAATGYVSESAIDGGIIRLDVIAQTLRVAVRLAVAEVGQRRPVLDRLERTLIAHVQANGALPFAVRCEPTSWSVWGAMFAEQALAWRRMVDSGAIASFDPYLV
jgi:hypothetical protein